MASGKAATPCVGVCSTVYGDQVCRGCKRLAAEIVRWNAYSDDERVAILARLDAMLEDVLSKRVVIDDREQLMAAVRRCAVRVQWTRGDWHLAAELLRTRADQIELAGCGLRAVGASAQLPLGRLRDEIEDELMARAGLWLAHCYGRYAGDSGHG